MALPVTIESNRVLKIILCGILLLCGCKPSSFAFLSSSGSTAPWISGLKLIMKHSIFFSTISTDHARGKLGQWSKSWSYSSINLSPYLIFRNSCRFLHRNTSLKYFLRITPLNCIRVIRLTYATWVLKADRYYNQASFRRRNVAQFRFCLSEYFIGSNISSIRLLYAISDISLLLVDYD